MPEFKQFPLADTAEGLTEAEILEWKVAPGDEVKVNQIVVEIETAKAAVELPIPWAGVVTELHVEPGQVVEVGTNILTIDVDPAGSGSAPAAAPAPAAAVTAEPAVNGAAAPATAAEGHEEMKPLVGYGTKAVATKRRPRKAAAAAVSGTLPVDTAAAPAGDALMEPMTAPDAPKGPMTAPPEPATPATAYVPLAKPPVRKLAKDLGIDLRTVIAGGQGGVITRDDVQRAATGAPGLGVVGGNTFAEPEPEQAPPPAAAAAPVDAASRERRVPIKGVRRMTAQAMVSSAFTAPHVTEFLTVDVTPMMELRQRLKSHPQFAGVKLTPMTFAAKAMILAAKRTPDVNATWDEAAQEIVYKDYVHLGVAAATPRGLVVPKVRDADGMSLVELARALEELTAIARSGKTPPEAMINGTITITNIGVFGVDTGTPIINPGESTIFAFGAIRDTPWVVDGEIVVRKVCQLALSFDHRVVDGQQGSQYLADVGALLADPAMALTF